MERVSTYVPTDITYLQLFVVPFLFFCFVHYSTSLLSVLPMPPPSLSREKTGGRGQTCRKEVESEAREAALEG